MGEPAPPHSPIEAKPEPTAAEPAELDDQPVHEKLLIEEELLIEEVSIDGMCGVY